MLLTTTMYWMSIIPQPAKYDGGNAGTRTDLTKRFEEFLATMKFPVYKEKFSTFEWNFGLPDEKMLSE